MADSKENNTNEILGVKGLYLLQDNHKVKKENKEWNTIMHLSKEA